VSLSRLGRAARTYAERLGIHVFALAPCTKIPLIVGGRGYLDATTDLATIEAIWTKHPNANIGASMIASGLVGIDPDLYKPGAAVQWEALVDELGPLPSTWTSRSGGGGRHYIFRDGRRAYIGALTPTCEIKHAGYLALAPSVHPNGKPYLWEHDSHPLEHPVADLPAAWAARMTTRPSANHLPSTGVDARISVLGAVLEQLGLLGPLAPDGSGKRFCRCPWSGQHSDGRGFGQDGSCVVFPRSEDSTLGGWKCAHGHCSHRSWKDVLDLVPPSVKNAVNLALAAELRRAA
jgi:hypothetical protein